jgi:hypothetical protein
MAKVTSVTVGLRRLYKHPFEDFENFTIEGSITSEVEPGETPAEAAAKSFPILREQMIATFKEFRPKPPAKEKGK